MSPKLENNGADLHGPDSMPVLSEETGRRSFLRRRRAAPEIGGRSLVDTVETEQLPEQLDEGEYLFGLEADLLEFGQNCRDHQAVVTAFNTEENIDHLSKASEALTDPTPDYVSARMANRSHRATAERDFMPIVTGMVLAGRLRAVHTSFRQTFKSVREGASHAELSQSSKLGLDSERVLLGVFNPTFARGEGRVVVSDFAKKLENLRSDSTKTFRPILGKRMDIKEHLKNKMNEEPATALQVIDTYATVVDSEVELENTFAKVVATDYREKPEDSALGYALNVLGSERGERVLVDKFMDKKFDPDEVDNMLGFVASQLKEDQDIDVKGYIRDNFDDWPETLRDEYAGYVKEFVGQQRVFIDKTTNSALAVRAWMLPDASDHAVGVDRLLRKMGGRVPKGVSKRNGMAKGRSVKQLSAQNVIDVTSTAEAEPQPLVLKDEAGNTEPSSIISNLVDRKYHRDQEYMSDLENMLGGLSANAGGEGIEAVRRKVMIDSRTARVYSLKGNKFPISTRSPLVNGSRIVFARTNGTGHILGIFASHKEYEEFIDNLPAK